MYQLIRKLKMVTLLAYWKVLVQIMFLCQKNKLVTLGQPFLHCTLVCLYENFSRRGITKQKWQNSIKIRYELKKNICLTIQTHIENYLGFREFTAILNFSIIYSLLQNLSKHTTVQCNEELKSNMEVLIFHGSTCTLFFLSR